MPTLSTADRAKPKCNADTTGHPDSAKQPVGAWILESENHPGNRQQPHHPSTSQGNQAVSLVWTESNLRNRKFYSYEELVSSNIPSDVDLRCRELHLSDSNFLRVFKMTKGRYTHSLTHSLTHLLAYSFFINSVAETFIQLPKWRQINLRKQYKLW